MRIAKIHHDYEIGDVFYNFYLGDGHVDGYGFDSNYFNKQMDYALTLNANIILMGDFLSMITHQDIKRYSKDEDIYETSDIINEAVCLAVGYLKPYAKNISVMMCGNHETYITKNHNIDIVKNIIDELNNIEGVDIQYLGYTGYIVHNFQYKKGGFSYKYTGFLDHGKGSGRGTTGLTAMMGRAIADYYAHAHTHHSIVLPSEIKSYINNKGNLSFKEIICFVVGACLKPITVSSLKKNGKSRAYNPNYGEEKMKHLQSRGGIFLQHTAESKEIIKTRVIC